MDLGMVRMGRFRELMFGGQQVSTRDMILMIESALLIVMTFLYATNRVVYLDSYSHINTTSYNNVTFYNCPTCNCQTIPDWLQVIKDFPLDKNYDRNGYNCRFYSAELATILQNMGYDAEQVCGRHGMELEEGHCWIRMCIEYEPQTGWEVNPEYYVKFEDMTKKLW